MKEHAQGQPVHKRFTLSPGLAWGFAVLLLDRGLDYSRAVGCWPCLSSLHSPFASFIPQASLLVPGISDSRWAKHWLQEQALSELISLDFTASWFL